MSKEQFLDEKGTRISGDGFHNFKNFSGNELPVCLMNNGMSTAARIVFSPEERDACSLPEDKRAKLFYLVSRKDLDPYYRDAEANSQIRDKT